MWARNPVECDQIVLIDSLQTAGSGTSEVYFAFFVASIFVFWYSKRNCFLQTLYGTPGTGKSFLVSLYNKLLGAENMGYLSASKLFAFQDLINKRLGAFEDIEWEQKAVMLKHMFEGAPLKVDQKYKPIAELILARSIVTTNHSLQDYFNKEDSDAFRP